MTLNEVNIIKNAVLDATEAYVDARLGAADFVKTQIGVVTGKPVKRNNKYYHTVVCNKTTPTNGITYTNVLSIGNIEFPNKSVVFLLAPNSQFSNQFILGKLDDTTFRVDSIAIGGTADNPAFKVDTEGNLTIGNQYNPTFEVTKDGRMTATSGSFTGTISTGSTITGSTISGGSITGAVLSGGSININDRFIVANNGNMTASDGSGTLKIQSGSLYISNYSPGGAGVFAEKVSGGLTVAYSCWGAVNSAASDALSYLETSTKNIIQAGINVSDKRLKKNIKDINNDFANELILNINPKQFKYKRTKEINTNDLYFGVIAQEIAEIEKKYNIEESNRLCCKREDGMYEVEYRQLIAPMIKVIQNQQSQIDKLKSEIENLRKED